MAGTAPRLEGPLHPNDRTRVIECSPFLLDDLRRAALESFNTRPHGGPELLGALFGARHGSELQITAFQAVPADTPQAGQGTFSETILGAFRDVLEGARVQHDAAALEPVGWFRAHPRSDLALSMQDLELYNSLFTEPWHVGMILRPGNSAPSCGRVYFREPDGPLLGFREFTHVVECAEEAGRATSPEQGLAALESAMTQPEVPAPDKPETPSDSTETDLQSTQLPAGLPVSVPDDPQSSVIEGDENAASRRSSMGRRILVAGTLLAAAAMAVAVYFYFYPPLFAPDLSLRLSNVDGQLRIAWNRDAVKSAAQGQVDVTDGARNFQVDLNQLQLQAGEATYARRTGEVSVRLWVLKPGETPLEQEAHFSGAAPRKSVGDGTGSRSRLAPLVPAEFVVPVPVYPVIEPNRTLSLPQTPRSSVKPVAALVDLSAPPVVDSRAASNLPSAVTQPVVRMPPPAEKPASPVSPPAAPAAVPNVARRPSLPVSGRLIWIGRLQKGESLTIAGKNASTGSLIGELPARPVKVSISPGDLSNDGIVLYTSNLQYANNVVEPPRAENGWNKTTYTWNPRYANDITMPEAPGAQNGWNRMVLRSKNPKLSVIVIDWAVVN